MHAIPQLVTRRLSYLLLFVSLALASFSTPANTAAEKSNTVEFISHSFKAGRKSFFNVGEQSERLRRGLTLVHFNSTNSYEFKTYDTYGDEEDLNKFLAVLERMVMEKAVFAILAHDSAVENAFENGKNLAKMGFKALSTLENRQAYVMHNLDGKINEYVDEAAVVLTAAIPETTKSDQVYFPKERYEFEASFDRFIAHAGGAVDGHAYTNTKNALDQNYEKGFRLFELDIIETSDGHFVAAHDWNMWSRFTEYSGKLPPTLEEFRNETIYGDYITMDMKAINDWFAAHPDAVLITDKISDPLAFADQFYDKEKLIMELFSPMSVEEASNNGIRAMISQKPLLALKGNQIDFLKANNVKYAAVSRRIIERKKKLMLKLRDSGIKVYVYNVNFDEGKDEKYVYENEIGLVYGMYADKWDFELEPSSTQVK
ncbi:hypothetical protein [Allomuricauda sp. d1]|uniref:hypothetical protein n=1 Tax=Allomuricauda sp. d1 TaxID=3136725 RepID=UPI0031D358A6